MKVLLPFWDLDIFERYIPQMRALAERLEEFHIIYLRGEPKQEWSNCITFHKVKLPSLPSYAAWLWGPKKIFKEIKLDIDLYYSLSGLWMQHFAARFSELADKPYTLRLRGDDNASARHRGYPLLKKMLFKKVYSQSFAMATLIVPIADKLRKVALSFGAGEERMTRPIPNGVDTELFRPIESQEGGYRSLTLGYAGRLSPEKGSDFLLDLMKKLPT